MSRFYKTIVHLAILLALMAATTNAGMINQTDRPVSVTWQVKIPMRDGVKLSGTLYRPADVEGPLPVILALTPYGADSNNSSAMYFARNGYAFITVDCRGRGNSDGTYVPYINDGPDGYDLVEWIAVQPWCNGKVAMQGLSYGGFSQWTTARELPPHLVTIMPAAAAYFGIDFPYTNGIFMPGLMEWVVLTQGRTADFGLFADASFWVGKINELYKKGLPVEQMDRVVGFPSAVFQTWLANRENEAYWAKATPSPEQFAKINIPILTITAYYDGDQRGALTYYRRHMQYAPASGTANHYLIIGPWDHGGTESPELEVGGLKLGAASKVDILGLEKEWLDWTLKGASRPEFLKDKVAFYVTGEEQWHYAHRLEDVANGQVALHLHSSGRADSVFHSGTLSESAAEAEPADSYVYDPMIMSDSEAGPGISKDYLLQQKDVARINGTGVVYHTDPLASDLTIAGDIDLRLWISMDVPDTDFMATLYEIQEDDTSIQLTRGALRARYRESIYHPKLATPGEITEYRLKAFQYFARRIPKGSRLRLVITAPDHVYFEKNYNSGGDVTKESSRDARTAHIKVFHDPQHPSVLLLPIIK